MVIKQDANGHFDKTVLILNMAVEEILSQKSESIPGHVLCHSVCSKDIVVNVSLFL